MFKGVVKTDAKLAVHLRSERITVAVGHVGRLVEVVLHAAYVAPEGGEFGCHPFLHDRVCHALAEEFYGGKTGLPGLGQKVEFLRGA